MLKNFLLISYFLSFGNFLFSYDSDLSPLNKQNQLDYFVIRFEVDQQDEDVFKKSFRKRNNDISFRCEEHDWEPGNYIIFFSHFKNEVRDTVTFFCLKNINFIPNVDIIIPINPVFNCFSISLKSKITKDTTHVLGFKKQMIMPGKRYTIKLKNLSFFPTPEELNSGDYSCRQNSPKVEIATEDILENQLKVRNVLNDVLEFIPADVNNLISEYLI